MENHPNYDIILSQTTLEMINAYKIALLSNTSRPGAYLKTFLNDKQVNLENISIEYFVQLLIWTKKPMIFAESAVIGNGKDWNMEELKILGDLSIGMNVKIFDNGIWSTRDEYFRQYESPLNGTLLFVPGPLLEGASVDLQEIIDGCEINQSKYNQLIDRRLTPVFHYINENAAKENVRAFVTIPGIGCGQFAGHFSGTMGERLKLALHSLLEKNVQKFGYIACVYYDPHSECTNQDFENVKLRVRPAKENAGRSLLCHPKEYEEQGDDFSNCKLFKVVAWDHVSYPGNDFFGNSRSTDDGVSAAATDSMLKVTGIEGKYKNGKYQPPEGYHDWLQVVRDNKIQLKVNSGNIDVYEKITFPKDQ